MLIPIQKKCTENIYTQTGGFGKERIGEARRWFVFIIAGFSPLLTSHC